MDTVPESMKPKTTSPMPLTLNALSTYTRVPDFGLDTACLTLLRSIIEDWLLLCSTLKFESFNPLKEEFTIDGEKLTASIATIEPSSAFESSSTASSPSDGVSFDSVGKK